METIKELGKFLLKLLLHLMIVLGINNMLGYYGVLGIIAYILQRK